MGTIADKLAKLRQTKETIRRAISQKGVTIPSTTPFRQFAFYIEDIFTTDMLPMLISPASAGDVVKGKQFYDEDLSIIEGTSTAVETGDATATPQDMGKTATAYVKGVKITGTANVYTSMIAFPNRVPYIDSQTGALALLSTTTPAAGWLFKSGAAVKLLSPLSNFGNATAADVRKGKTFTSTAGIKVTGTGNF